MALKEKVEKAEDVAGEAIVDIIKYHNEHIFITESGHAVLLEKGTLPNAVFTTVEDAERNLDYETRKLKKS